MLIEGNNSTDVLFTAAVLKSFLTFEYCPRQYDLNKVNSFGIWEYAWPYSYFMLL